MRHIVYINCDGRSATHIVIVIHENLRSGHYKKYSNMRALWPTIYNYVHASPDRRVTANSIEWGLNIRMSQPMVKIHLLFEWGGLRVVCL